MQLLAARCEPLPARMIALVLRGAIEEVVMRVPERRLFVVTGFPDDMNQVCRVVCM